MLKYTTPFTTMTGVRLPIIMAPMFLVSNLAMMKSAVSAGVMGVFPSLNFRESDHLSEVLEELNRSKSQVESGSYGVNLIVQKTNRYFRRHLEICEKQKVPFYITSLGNPAEVIERAHSYGARVFCDVTNMKHAEKAAKMGCDGFIAVGQGAGGHAGPNPLTVLVPALRLHFPDQLVIAAGGIATGSGIISMLATGAAGVSIGTRFIASTEADVVESYKSAVVQSGMDDIVMTERLSGTPCTIINTPDAKRIGYRQNFFERLMSNNQRTKKYFKMLVQYRGMKKLEDAVKPGNYSNLWCAGKSVALVNDIISCDAIIRKMEAEMEEALYHLNQMTR
jgi:nitronate monooxygenase